MSVCTLLRSPERHQGPQLSGVDWGGWTEVKSSESSSMLGAHAPSLHDSIADIMIRRPSFYSVLQSFNIVVKPIRLSFRISFESRVFQSTFLLALYRFVEQSFVQLPELSICWHHRHLWSSAFVQRQAFTPSIKMTSRVFLRTAALIARPGRAPYQIAVTLANSRLHLRYATTVIKVPTMAESISEGTLKQFSKKVGDYVEQDEEIATIETDKVRRIVATY